MRRFKGLGRGQISALAVLACLACRQVVDFRDPPAHATPTGSDPPVDAGVDAWLASGTNTSVEAGIACGLPYSTGDCASCVATNCCQPSSACAADLVCRPYAACVGACGGDPACRSQCELDSPPPSSGAGSELSACMAAHCESACALTCGAPAGYDHVPPTLASGCQSCLAANGCDAGRGCGGSADCDALRRCLDGCWPAIDCREACLDAHDAGWSLLYPLWSTVSGCATECGRGADWSCVGHVSWPRPKSDTVTMTIRLNDFVTGAPVPSVDVTVCDRVDLGCANPKAHGESNADGGVVLQLSSLASTGTLSGLEVPGLDGYFLLTSSSILPSRFYWGFPLSEPQIDFTPEAEQPPASRGGLRLFTPAYVNMIAAQAGITIDPNLGVLAAIATDCSHHFPAPGVQFTTNLQDAGIETYNGTTTVAASGSSVAFFFNVPVGLVDVTATPLALGKPSSHQRVGVMAGGGTAVIMTPTP